MYQTPQAELPRFTTRFKRNTSGKFLNAFRLLSGPPGVDAKTILYSLVAYNKGGSPLYLLLFDINWTEATITKIDDFADRVDFSFCIPIGAGGLVSLEYSPFGWVFNSGLTIVASTTDTLVTLAGHEVSFDLKYE